MPYSKRFCVQEDECIVSKHTKIYFYAASMLWRHVREEKTNMKYLADTIIALRSDITTEEMERKKE